MRRDKRKVEQALLRKGFEQDDTHGHQPNTKRYLASRPWQRHSPG